MKRVPPFQPFGDRVLVCRVPEPGIEGVLIPDGSREKALVGEIISVGDGLRSESGVLLPVRAKAGDLILFGKYAGTEMPKHSLLELPPAEEESADEPQFLVMREEEIIGFVTSSNNSTSTSAVAEVRAAIATQIGIEG